QIGHVVVNGEAQHLFVESPYHLIGMTVYLYEVIVTRLYVFAVRGYIDAAIRPGLYISRIGTYFYLLDFGERRDIDHRDRAVYPDAFPVQSSGIGNIQLSVLHADAVRVSACPGQCVDGKRGSIYSRHCSVEGTHVCLASVESDVAGLPGTSV